MQQKTSYSFLQLIKDLSYYIRPYRRMFWGGVFFRATSDISNLYPAWATSQIVLILTQYNSTHLATLLWLLIGFAAVVFYFGIAHETSKNLGFQVAERVGLDLYKRCLTHILKLDLFWQEKENSGNKMKRMDRGYDGMNQIIRRVFDVLIEVVVNIIGTLFIFAAVQPVLSLSLIFFIVTYFLLGTVLLKPAIRQEQITNKKAEDLGGLVFESLNNIHTIKSLAINHGILTAVSAQVANLFAEIKKRIFYFRIQDGALLMYQAMFEFVVVCFLVWHIVEGRANVSILILFIGLFQKVSVSTQELTQVTQDIILAKIWISRAIQILQTKPIIENEKKEQKAYPEEWKKLQIKNVHFSYGNHAALNGLNLTINRGESIGIVGLSGAGKSTLFKLLLDLYEDYQGDILLDDISFKEMDRQSYINNVSVVLQDTELFNLSLKENIALAATGKKHNPPFDVIIHMAHLADVVSHLPQGLQTVVGEKGIKLSGGQRQRVGIARALFRQPDILLMDEATSHLDAYSEKQIQEALQESMHRFTTIIIAHRLSTIKKMDKIVVLQKGRIAEFGTFKSLIEKKGIFARMWQEQKL